MRSRPGSYAFNEWLRIQCENEDAVEAQRERARERAAAAATESQPFWKRSVEPEYPRIASEWEPQENQW